MAKLAAHVLTHSFVVRRCMTLLAHKTLLSVEDIRRCPAAMEILNRPSNHLPRNVLDNPHIMAMLQYLTPSRESFGTLDRTAPTLLVELPSPSINVWTWPAEQVGHEATTHTVDPTANTTCEDPSNTELPSTDVDLQVGAGLAALALLRRMMFHSAACAMQTAMPPWTRCSLRVLASDPDTAPHTSAGDPCTTPKRANVVLPPSADIPGCKSSGLATRCWSQAPLRVASPDCIAALFADDDCGSEQCAYPGFWRLALRYMQLGIRVQR